MTLPSPVRLFVAVVSVVFVAGGLIAFSRPSVNIYHVSRLVFIFLALTSAVYGLLMAALIYAYGGWLIAGFAGIVLGIALWGTILFATVGEVGNFKTQASILVGLTSAIGVAIVVPVGGGVVRVLALGVLAVVVGIFTWESLRSYENRAERSFNERMTE